MIPAKPLSRRSLLASTSAAALALALPVSAVEAPALRYLLASSMYGNLPLADVVAEAPRTGATHLDLWPKPHATHREQAAELGDEAFAALLDKHRVKLAMITRYDLGPFRLADELPYAKRFGAQIIVTGSGGPARLSAEELKTAAFAFVEKLKPHAAAAAQAGVTLAIENHAKSLAESPDSLCWVAHAADAAKIPNLGIALAPYHLPQEPALLAKLIEDLGPRLAHFYAWQHGKGSTGKLTPEEQHHQLPGVGPLDFAPILAALRKIRYPGFVSVFMHPIPRGIPILPTAAEVTAAINKGRAYLDELAVKQL